MTQQQASTIVEQLGGNKFIAMTGAKNFLRGDFDLRFQLPRNPGKISWVKITLSGDDTYRMEFHGKDSIKSAFSSVYNNEMAGIFERQTFLRVSL